MDEVMTDLQDLFREVFDDDEIDLRAETVADDIDGWDSLAHVNLIVAIEGHFGVRFATAEISAMKADDQNVGSMADLLREKIRNKA